MSETPELRHEGSVWTFSYSGMRAEFSHLHQENSGLHGEISVKTTLPGIPPHLHEARLNLSSTTARGTLAKAIAKRGGESLAELAEDFVEMSCVMTTRAFRQGEPFVDLAEQEYQEPQFAVGHVWPLNKRGMIFGPAESLKTITMMASALDVVTGESTLGFDVQPGAVALMDWETDAADATNLWHRLARGRGLAKPPRLLYRRCHSPVWSEAESASVEFAREGVSFVFLDSAFWACGGDPNSQENVGRMFEGIDALGSLTSVLINHTAASEADKARRRHYGVEHFRNAVRASWELRKAENPLAPSAVDLGLYRDKLNIRRREGPFGFRVSFEGDSGPIRVDRYDDAIAESPALDASRPATDRIYDELTHGRATLKQLGKALDMPDGTVKSAVYRLGAKVRGRWVDKEYFYELAASE
jgi:hypothetical protein